MTNLRSFHAVGTACCNLLLEKDEHPKCKTDNLWDSARLLWCARPGHHLVVQSARRLITKIQLDLSCYHKPVFGFHTLTQHRTFQQTQPIAQNRDLNLCTKLSQSLC